MKPFKKAGRCLCRKLVGIQAQAEPLPGDADVELIAHLQQQVRLSSQMRKAILAQSRVQDPDLAVSICLEPDELQSKGRLDDACCLMLMLMLMLVLMLMLMLCEHNARREAPAHRSWDSMQIQLPLSSLSPLPGGRDPLA